MKETPYIFRVRTYTASALADVWLSKRDGGALSLIMHGQALPDTLRGLLDLLDALEGVVEVYFERSSWEGPAVEKLEPGGLFAAAK